MTKTRGRGAVVAVVVGVAACGGAPRPAARAIGNSVAVETAAIEEARAPRAPVRKVSASTRTVVHLDHAAIRRCYTLGLLDDPKLAGSTRAVFTIAPDGKVSAVSASSGVEDVGDACLARVIENAVRSPQPPADVAPEP
jgi:hypothetical protein